MMARIDETRPFVPVNIAVLTVSDTRDATNDTSGDALAERIAAAGHSSPRARSNATTPTRSWRVWRAGSPIRRST